MPGHAPAHHTPLNTHLPTTGIDILLQDLKTLEALKHQRVGLLTNLASVTQSCQPTAYALSQTLGPALCFLLTPEHGWSGFYPHGQTVANDHESVTGLPVYSLYGPRLEESLQHLASIDTLIIDLQDVGVRCYTYTATCARLLEHMAKQETPPKIVICDRPNPLGIGVKGPLPQLTKRALINHLDIPYLHGKTLGQLLQEHCTHLDAQLSLSIKTSQQTFDPTTHLWIPPSPGLPTWASVFLYPGLVLLEGTNVSEGRGTSLPFQCVAAPNLDTTHLTQALQPFYPTLLARPLMYTPTTDKLAGQLCQGVQLHLTESLDLDSVYLGIVILQTLHQHDKSFSWVFAQETYWIDALTGNEVIRKTIDAGKMPQEVYEAWCHS